MKECVKLSGAKIEVSTANPYLYTVAEQPGAMPFIGMGMNQIAAFQMQNMDAMSSTPASAAPGNPDEPWNCPCGQTGLTGKFCPECGNPRC